MNAEESAEAKRVAKTCVTPDCERPLPFPQWYMSKAKRCSVCIAKIRLAEARREH